MLLANFNRKEHVRHRAVSLRQHGFLVDIHSCSGKHKNNTVVQDGPKIKLQTLIHNIDGFYRFIFRKASICSLDVVVYLVYSIFITNFPQNVPVKKVWKIGQYLAQIWTKVAGDFLATLCKT